MKKIIITGAGGEVGLNILSLISPKKYEIIAIDKSQKNIKLTNKLFPKIKTINEDLSKKGTWEKSFQNADVIIQLHAQISSPEWEKYKKNNIDAIKNVLDICEKYKIKHLIHISSSVVESIAKDGYTESKRQGEKLVKISKIPHTILRPTLMYGCFDVKHLGFLTKIIDKFPVFPVPGSGKYIRQPLFVQDFAKIIINCIERKPNNKVFNISGKEKIYFINMLKLLAKAKKRKILFITIPIPLFQFMLKIYSLLFGTHYIPDQLKAMTAGDLFEIINWEKEFNIKPTNYRNGIKKMINSKYYGYSKEMEKH